MLRYNVVCYNLLQFKYSQGLLYDKGLNQELLAIISNLFIMCLLQDLVSRLPVCSGFRTVIHAGWGRRFYYFCVVPGLFSIDHCLPITRMVSLSLSILSRKLFETETLLRV